MDEERTDFLPPAPALREPAGPAALSGDTEPVYPVPNAPPAAYALFPAEYPVWAGIPPPITPKARPTAERERIQALDVLRGIAIFGILFVNIEDFGLLTPSRYDVALSGGTGPVNYYSWLFTIVFTDTKFIAIFTLLFGAGIALLWERRRPRQKPGFFALYYRRMLVLLAIGVAHYFFLWDGDILHYYALWGLVLIVAAPLPWPVLLIVAAAGIYIHGNVAGDVPLKEYSAFYPEPYRNYVIEVMHGPWSAQYEWRTRTIPTIDGEINKAFTVLADYPRRYAFNLIGWMCLGMALLKCGFLRGTWRNRWYALIAAAAFPPGLFLVSLAFGWRPEWEEFGIKQGFYYGSMLLTFSYCAAAVLWAKLLPRFFLTRATAAAGRMALTNYLMHTVICTWIFYGWGLGLYEQLERFQLLLVLVAIVAAQLVLSSAWLKLFRFGPAEWIWRTLTYLRWQPLLKPVRAVPVGPAPASAPTMDRIG